VRHRAFLDEGDGAHEEICVTGPEKADLHVTPPSD
jgi:hypothetical protein